MIYLILIFAVLFFILAWRRLDLAVMFLIAALPAYLIRFSVFGLPATLLEAMIWIVFTVWLLRSYKYIIENLKLKIGNCKLKINNRYPFDWEIVLMLLAALAAAGAAGFSSDSLGIWKAYFFEPAMFFIVVLNVMKGDTSVNSAQGGGNKILWALAVSALAVSALAIYQKVTGQLIDNQLWAAADTRRVVSFFGYPNAVGLYLGPIALVLAGWFMGLFKDFGKGKNFNNQAPAADKISNDKVKIIFIGLTIILSLLSVYFAKSKGALLGAAAGLIVFGLLVGGKIRCATIIILILIGFGAVAYEPAGDLAVSNIALTNLSGQIRKAGWADSWRMLKDGRLLTGAGLANYQAAVAPYHTQGIFIKDFSDPEAQRKLVFNEAYRAAHWQPLEIYLYPHNIVLNFWSELGLAGLLLFTWIIGKFFYLGAMSYKKLSASCKFINIGLICAMVAIVVHGLVDVPYFKNDLAMMFWLFIAMISMINLEIKYGENNLQ